jgi:hypothetical protein
MESDIGWQADYTGGVLKPSPPVVRVTDHGGEGPVTDQSVKSILKWPNLPSTPPHNEPTPRATRLVQQLTAQLQASITFALSPHRANSD